MPDQEKSKKKTLYKQNLRLSIKAVDCTYLIYIN